MAAVFGHGGKQSCLGIIIAMLNIRGQWQSKRGREREREGEDKNRI